VNNEMGTMWKEETAGLKEEARVRVRVSPCGISGGESDTVTSVSPSSSIFPSICHSGSILILSSGG
jgi:hypothetical protein